MKNKKLIFISAIVAIISFAIGFGVAKIKRFPIDLDDPQDGDQQTVRQEMSINYRQLVEFSGDLHFSLTPDFTIDFALGNLYTKNKSVVYNFDGILNYGVKQQNLGFKLVGDLCVEKEELTLKNIRFEDLIAGENLIINTETLASILNGFVKSKLKITPFRLQAGCLDVLEAYSALIILKVKEN